MLEADRYWGGLCAALGQPELAQDSRFGSLAARAANSAACVEVLDAIFANMTLAQIAERLNSQEGQWAAVELPGDAVKDAQSLANGYVQMVRFENGADLPFVPVPARIDGDTPVLSRAPGHCEHTDDVLAKLGLSPAELIELKVAGVIG
jgi:crotonobetainyl-CoA:carnitine CoA-transferase CaiB-like acyl-CoA transferase